MVANAGHAVRNRDARKAAAVVERRIANAGHAIGDCDARKAAAIFKRRIANAGHAVRNRDAGKFITAAEGIAFDGCNASRERNSLNRSTVLIPGYLCFIVIASHCAAAGDLQKAGAV